jgi:hypothetical protein
MKFHRHGCITGPDATGSDGPAQAIAISLSKARKKGQRVPGSEARGSELFPRTNVLGLLSDRGAVRCGGPGCAPDLGCTGRALPGSAVFFLSSVILMVKVMARKRSDYAFLDVESYKIAQLFHELSLDCGERLAAAQQVARRHGVSAQRVLDLAAKFEPEPLWRL